MTQQTIQNRLNDKLENALNQLIEKRVQEAQALIQLAQSRYEQQTMVHDFLNQHDIELAQQAWLFQQAQEQKVAQKVQQVNQLEQKLEQNMVRFLNRAR